MATFANILIFHPGAIGDVMLATPVSATLKFNFPQASLSYVTHPSLEELLGLCGTVDRVIPYRRSTGLFEQWNMLASVNADLIVDLAGSFKSWILTRLPGAKVLCYAKQRPNMTPVEHAVDNFLATLQPLALRPLVAKFPTLSPGLDLTEAVFDRLTGAGYQRQTIIGLVPGVGKLRPHRAWSADRWVLLGQRIIHELGYVPVLVGGADESPACQEIARQAGEGCLDVSGQLSLVETAALLKSCRAVVSGDTGPAHMAVAVGTPVVGLYGPTMPERSGPYGCNKWLVDYTSQCCCHNLKFCQVHGVPREGPGECMRQIAVQEALAMLELATRSAH